MKATSAALYGKGVFTTVAIESAQPLLWSKHWHRLEDDAGKIGVDLSKHSDESTKDRLIELISSGDLVHGRARICFLDDRPSGFWPAETTERQTTSLHIILGERRLIPETFRLGISPYPVNARSPLAGVKSCNYLEPIMSLDEAKGCGFDEAVRLNENGHVTSACMANVFWLIGERLFTPSLTTGCLPGTTREFVLENIECEAAEASIDELNAAEAVFLTSAGIGIVRVAEFDGRILVDPQHPIQTLWPN
ncbi:MAG: aminotransferase class IV [Pyrinomonadaceae bacterium]